MVYVPVEVYSATEEHRPQFHQLQRGSKERVRYKRVNEKSGSEVQYDDIVKGFEVGRGRQVVLEKEELEAVMPTKSRTIDIEDFVDLDQIDPIVWNKTYYLGPADTGNAEKPYALLRRAMEATNKVAVGRFVMRSRQYLVTIRPYDDALLLQTMYFADEIRGLDTLKHPPSDVNVTSKEVEMAEKLISSLSVSFEHRKYKDTYQERVMALIKRKAKGEPIGVEPANDGGAEVIDLMEALKRSLDAPRQTGGARGRGSNHDAPPKGSPRKAANDNLSELSKSELLERAAQAEIAGRSKMNRQQLIMALKKVS
jgi:DNA end-binding protein Ku